MREYREGATGLLACEGLFVTVEAIQSGHYVGTVLAPKSLTPCAVYVLGEDIQVPYALAAPDQSRVYASGDLEPDVLETDTGCARQHAMIGVCAKQDRGKGLGAALYMGGVMVVKASLTSPWRFPFDVSEDGVSQACTFSPATSFERAEAASRLWDSLRRKGLASRGYDAEDLNLIDVLTWEKVSDSGLILDLGRFFGRLKPRAFVPPAAMGAADWARTPSSKLVRYVRTNAAVAGEPGTAAHEDYVVEVLQALEDNGWSDMAEDVAAAIPAPEAVANPSRFAKFDKEWAAVYGPDTEWE